MKVYYDLHIHSVLSPCGSEDMTPNNIVNMAWIKGLEVIAVTDHNTMRNVPVVMELAKQKNIIVIPGIEVTTKEDIHVLCYFKDIVKGMEFQNLIYESLPKIKNKEEIFGRQVIMNEKDEEINKLDKLLLNATNYSVSDVYRMAGDFGGIMVPAHINKMSNSILANLGFMPFDLDIKTIEVYNKASFPSGFDKNKYLCITNSDAHYLEDISEMKNIMDIKEKSIGGVFDYISRGE